MKCMMGTADGRSICFEFKDNYEMRIETPFITRTQKKQETRCALLGQVNAVDVGYHNYETFAIIGGT